MPMSLSSLKKSSKRTSIKIDPKHQWLVILLSYASVFYVFQNNNLPSDFQFVLGIVLSPFIFRKTSGEASNKYYFIALLFFVLLLLRRSSSLYFFGFGFSLLYVLEKYWGRLNTLPVFFLLIISPLFSQFTQIWSFPIRLEQSAIAAKVLAVLGYEALAEGNIIKFNGNDFSVDPACMGLKMIITALLLGLVILAFYERKNKQQFNFIAIASSLSLVFVLTVLANFTRLLALVLFQIAPDNPLHDLIGLGSLVLYVVLPSFFLFGKWKNTVKENTQQSIDEKPNQRNYVNFNTALLFLLLIFTGRQFLKKEFKIDHSFEQIQIEGFEKSVTTSGVLKLENEKALIYIKAAASAFQGSHDPRYCWLGSGYEFKKIKKERIAGIELYTAELTKGEDILHTAWWFDNGKTKTIREWQWRWETLQGEEGFRLINLSANSKAELEHQIKSFLSFSLFF